MGVFTERHVAVVTDTDDPEQRGRIRVACPALTGDEETALPDFIEPVFDWGWFAVPDVGETVEIEVVTSSDQDESTAQAFLEAPDVKWRAKRYYDTGADSPEAPLHPDFTAENYGKRRGYASKNGMILLFDDEAGTMSWTWMKQNDAGEDDRSSILFDEDGKIHITHKKDHVIVLEDTKVSITLAGGNALTLEDADGNATATFGDGAVHPAIVEHLKALYEEAKDVYDNHTHDVPDGKASQGTGTGNLGIPVTTSISNETATAEATQDPFPDWDSAIESTKVSIPDG